MIVRDEKGNIEPESTPKQWAEWASYKSNKDRWIEQEEKEAEELEEWLRNYYLGL